MKLHLQKKLDWHTERLFTEGACHVFADELLTALVSSGPVLRRLVLLEGTTAADGAEHVVVSCGSDIIDVKGRKPAAECLQEYKDKLNGDVELVQCSREELFSPVLRPLSDEERGVRNRWLLHLDPEFVDACRSIARRVIDLYPSKFGVSLAVVFITFVLHAHPRH
jgi:hypothetical protein